MYAHVLELEVAVHDADAVQMEEAHGQLAREPQLVADGRGPRHAEGARGRLQCVGQRAALLPRHHEAQQLDANGGGCHRRVRWRQRL